MQTTLKAQSDENLRTFNKPRTISERLAEAATVDSTDKIHQIIDSNEPKESGYWFKRWWDRHVETFNVARSSDDRVDAFYFAFEPEKVEQVLLHEDPFTSNWLRHLSENPLTPGERVLFLPGWLDRTTGDGFFATFDQPANAIRCAFAVSKQICELGLEIRAGLHLGECEVTVDAVRGITVHIGARVAAKARAGEVLVSSTLKDAMAGSEIEFNNRGAYEQKVIPGDWRLYAVEP
jgi:class 3 adenylate cyclase